MNRLIWLLSLLCICFVFTSCEKDEDAVTGCIDNMALNYNSNATEDDGSCDYDCPNNGTEDLFERTWAVIYAEYEEGGCAWYCDQDLAPDGCQAYDYDINCLAIKFESDGTFEGGMAQSYDGDYSDITGTWSGKCDAGDVITIKIDGESEAFGTIVFISEDELVINDGGDIYHCVHAD